jgi:hypothetical protein
VFDRKPPRLEWRRGSGSWVFDRLEEQGSLYDTDVTTLVHAMDNELSSLCVRSVMDVNSGSNTDIVLHPKTLFHVNEAGAVPFIKKKKNGSSPPNRPVPVFQFLRKLKNGQILKIENDQNLTVFNEPVLLVYLQLLGRKNDEKRKMI